jgi:predicted MFS family arabinose efflux permease
MNAQSDARPSLAQLLALNRTVAVVLLAVLFFGLGEQLWEPFMSVYLAAEVKLMKKAATVAGSVGVEVLWLVGAYAFLRNLFEGFCYIGGGQLTARLGDRGSLLLFGLLTVAGYVLFLAWQAPAAAVVAALLILGWEPLSVPVTFTTVGSTVGLPGRGMAFALQSIQKRLPKILGPLLAGFVLYRAELLLGSKEAGRVAGMRWLVGLSLALGAASLLIQIRWMPHLKPPPPGPSTREVLRQMHPTLRRLLLAEVFKRWCDWMVREFGVLYVVVVRGVSVEAAGVFLAVQHLTALLTYLPVGRLTRTVGLQPFIGVTFIFFALFPLTLALLPGGWWLALAFVVNGLRETGEPARKALITSLLPEAVRARGVGLYWGLRSFAICPASLAGAAAWYWLGPQALLYAAFFLGGVGAALYYLLCRGPDPVLKEATAR